MRVWKQLAATAVLLGIWALSEPARAERGEELFESLKCTSCHKPNEQVVGPSLAEIARTYDDKNQLITYFDGQGRPRIESDKPGMMRGQLTRIKALPEEDKKTLADYIFSFK